MKPYRKIVLLVLFTLALPAAPAAPVTDAAHPPAGPPSPVSAPPSAVAPSWLAVVQEDIRRSEYDVTWQDATVLPDLPAAYQAPNRVQGFRTYFTPGDIRVVPRTEVEPSWRLVLGLVEDNETGTAVVTGNRYEVARERGDAGAKPLVDERYVNGEEGLETTFVRYTLPVSSSPVLELALSTTLAPRLAPDGTTVELADGAGAVVLSYGPFAAVDATGRDLSLDIAFSSCPAASLSPCPRVSLSARFPFSPSLPLTITGRLSSPVRAGAINASYPVPAWGVYGQQNGGHLGWSVGTAGDVNGDGYDDIIVGAPDYDNGQADEGQVYVYHGWWSEPGTTPDWTAEGNQAGARFGSAVGTAGDVDGDGYADVIIGAPAYDNGQTDEGRAYLYRGSAAGLATSPAWTAEGDQAGAQFGYAVGTAGDVNHDTLADVIVGAPYYIYNYPEEGRAVVYHGTAGGLSPTPNWADLGDGNYARFGWSVNTAGDVNGDGYADVVVGAPVDANLGRARVYHGGAGGLSPAPNWSVQGTTDSMLGYSVSTAGDVNGDGYADVIVGAPSTSDLYRDDGWAYLYRGSAGGLSGTASWSSRGDLDLDRFGWSVATAGDINGDGYADVVIGAPTFQASSVGDQGRVYFYLGSASSLPAQPSWTYDGEYAWCLGFAVAPAGDVNGDEYADVLAGGPYSMNPYTEGGVVGLFYGREFTPLPAADWTAPGAQSGAQLGAAVTGVGDVDGDGYSDVLVAAPYYDNGEADEGRAYLYRGSAAGPEASPDWTAEGNQAGARFGVALATAGDVDGDGYADVLVGAPFYDNGETDEGRAYLYRGGSAGLGATPAWSAEADQSSARLGAAVGLAGDVNADGYTDVLVGGPYYDNSAADEGRAWLYVGSAAGLGTTPVWSVDGGQAGAHLGAALDMAGDVNGDGYADVIVGLADYDNTGANAGRAQVYHGSPGGLSSTASWTGGLTQANAHYGFAVGTAGDVNGDGYSDVVIGAPDYDYDDTNQGRTYIYLGSAAGLAPSASRAYTSEQRSGRLGASVSTAGDWNGDGYADVVVGAPGEERAYVYQGSAAGMPVSAAWYAQSDYADDSFGAAVGAAGDVNGDGYSDIVVGAPTCQSPAANAGQAHVFYGAAAGPGETEVWSAQSSQGYAHLGISVGTAGDVNGDDYADLIVGAEDYDNGQANEGRVLVWYGSAQGLGTNGVPGNADWSAEGNQAGARFGHAVGTAGDVNGDGYADVIVGAPFYDNGQTDEGQVYVYHGGPAGLSPVPGWTAESDQANGYLGSAVDTAGDVNGDGYADVAVGTFPYDYYPCWMYPGRAHVYHGSPTGLSSVPNWSYEGSYCLGTAVGTAGDVNGDGYADLIVGAPGDLSTPAPGAAVLFYGSPTGLDGTVGWVGEGVQNGTLFGYAAGTSGDVNGDGYSDIIVGAPLYENGETYEGAVYVYHGSAAGPGSAPDWQVEGARAAAYLGAAAATAGDVNGDGYADVVVGAPWYPVYFPPSPTPVGRAYLYHGGPAGLEETAAWKARGNWENAEFGIAVGTAGDVNGDGYADIIVGADASEMSEQGQVFLYYGNAGDGLDLLPRQMRTDGTAPIAPQGLSDAETAVQLRLAARMPLGRAGVKLQWQIAPLGTPFTVTTGVISGTTPAWTDTLIGGVVISPTAAGLTPDTAYHWRVRLLYRPGSRMAQGFSRWIHMPWSGWNETDLRTPAVDPVAGLAAANDSPTMLGWPTTLTATVTAGDPVSFTWSFGDGSPPFSASCILPLASCLTHTYPAAGVYTAVVTASNSISLLTATTRVTVTPCLARVNDALPLYPTVQAAVDASAHPTDVVKVAGYCTGVEGRPAPPGYVGPAVITQVVYISKSLTLQGGYTVTNWAAPDPDAYPATLDAQGKGRVLLIAGDVSVTVAGLRVTGGDAAGLEGAPWESVGEGVYGMGTAAVTGSSALNAGSAAVGGGLYVLSATATISNNRVYGNAAGSEWGDDGAGLYLRGGAATICNNRVYSNTASFGAILLDASTAAVRGNTIQTNEKAGLRAQYGDYLLVGNEVTGNGQAPGYGWGWGAMFYYAHVTFTDNLVDANWGGGVYVGNSRSELSANRIAANRAGGGLLIEVDRVTATVSLISNTIAANVGLYGGGLYMDVGYADVALAHNLIMSNTANSQGGGLYLDIYGGNEVSLSHNMILSNTAADRGAGAYIMGESALLTDNTFSGNSAGDLGGGVCTFGVAATFIRNTFAANVARWGGGLVAWGPAVNLIGNTVISNTAAEGGGGLCLYGSAESVVGNSITHNWSPQGGGLYVEASSAALTNNVVADNQSTVAGSGLYISGGSPHLVHTTVARNSGGDGSGIYVDDTWGASTIAMTNTILVSHTVGLYATAGSTVTLAGTLWGNGTDWAGPGAIVTGTVNVWGDPAFVDPAGGDYHLRGSSAAIDRGVDVGVSTDIDGDPRPIGAASDLGADEYPAALLVSKVAGAAVVPAGGVLTYTLYLTNTGLVTQSAAITDVLPANVFPTGLLTWTALLPPAGVWTQTVVVTVNPFFAGVLTNTVEARTAEGGAGTAWCTVTVGVPVAGPAAVNDSPTALGWPTTLTATVTAGDPVSFTWSFGDGSPPLSASCILPLASCLTHTYPASGVYTAVVTASNSISLLTATTRVTVSPCLARLNDALPLYPTVQAAIDASTQPDDVIKVAGYCTDVNSYGGLAQVAYIDRSLTLRGGYTVTNWFVPDPEANPTTLDAQWGGRGIYITNYASVTIAGLRVTGGDPAGLGGFFGLDVGGGIYTTDTRVAIRDCTIRQNRQGINGEGAGLFLQSYTAVVERNRIIDNYGDGLYGYGGNIELHDNLVSTNTTGIDLQAQAVLIGNTIAANSDGGVTTNSTIALTGNVVVSNTALASCGGLSVHGGNLTAYDNLFAFNSGGGVGALCVWEGSATLIGNTFAQNQGGGNGGGTGGVSLYGPGSSATLLDNDFISNTAAQGSGGGLYVENVYDLFCSGNRFAGNSAVGNGGGLYIQVTTGQLLDNTILSNTSSYAGGGAYIDGDVVVSGNEIAGNQAQAEGGGLYVGSGLVVITGNTISANTAVSGGGLYSYASGLVRGNTFSYNTAGDGGGLYDHSYYVLFESNLLFGNSSSQHGGGMYLQGDGALVNNVLLDNEAASGGSGIYILNSSPRLEFTTLHSNSGGDGSGVYVASGRPLLSNTIVASQSVGIWAASGAQATVDGVLWYGNGANTGGPGTILVDNAWTGDPRFGPDGYHLQPGSAAVDRGVATDFPFDIDDEYRLQSLPPDLGADEIVVATSPCRARLNGGGPIYTRIQEAIDASTAPEDVIQVSGLCRDAVAWSGELRVAVLAKTLTLRGGYSSDFSVWDPLLYPTVLDGEQEHGVLVIQSSINPTVEYLTLVRGYAETGAGLYSRANGAVVRHLDVHYMTAHYGAGVLLGGTSRLETCSIAENQGTGQGAGLQVSGGRPVISDTEIVDNAGGSAVWLFSTSATLVGNRIADNADEGVRVTGGYAVLRENDIASNRNGGVNLESGSTTLERNVITGNQCYYGAGIYAAGRPTILENTVTGNNAYGGGGVYLAATPALFQGNVISGNYALYGAGVYVRAPSTLSGNTIGGNHATRDGGGLYVDRTTATLDGNTIRANLADRNGGGLMQNQGTVISTANLFWSNTAQRGGASYLATGQATLANTIIADNQATVAGGGLYVVNSPPVLVHTTIAHNTGGDGSGIYYDASGRTMVLTNTIIVSQTIGVYAPAGTVRLESTLWNGNDQDWSGAGIVHNNDYTGPAAFRDPAAGDYHLRGGSAAIDRGVDAGVSTDVDGDPRPIGAAPDLGADEFRFPLEVDKEAGATLLAAGSPLTYTLRLTNTAPVTQSAAITDVLPANVLPTGFLTWTALLPPASIWTQTVVVTVNPSFSGVLTNTVEARTAEGGVGTAWCTVTVEVPVAGLSAVNDSPTALGAPTALTATVVAGDPVAFIWAFGDGSSGSGPAVGHVYPAVGVYTAVVTASNQVSLLTATTVVTVEEAISGLSATNDSPTALGSPTTLTATVTAGDPVAFTWAFGDGSGGSGPAVGHVYPAVGVYTAVVTASNQVSLLTATTVVTVEEAVAGLSAVNDSPTALGAPTTLTATVASGDPVAFTWAFGDGSGGSGPAVGHVYPAVGVYTAVVTASNQVSLLTATTVVTVEEAVAGLSATNDSPTALGDPTTLTATVTAGEPVAFTWAFGDGSSGSGPAVGHVYPAVGVYTAVVTASNQVSLLTATTVVTVEEAAAGLAAMNDSPTALGDPTTLTATVASGDPVAFAWAFGDGSGGSGPAVGHVYPAVGVYTAVVTASNQVSLLTATTVVTVEEAVAGLSAVNDSPTALGDPTTLTATVTAGDPVAFTWAFGDGSGGSGPAVGHVYPATGVYTAVVTASNQVSLLTATTVVTVEEAVAGLSATNDSPTALGDPTTLTATVTAGDPVAFTWAFGDGSGGSGPAVGHVYPAVGVYTAVVTASNQVSLLTATTVVTVEEAVAGLSAANDSPTALGDPTTLTATVVAGEPVAFAWAFGDGSGGSGACVTHIYPEVGVYTTLVTVSNQVSLLTATTVVTVEEAISGLSATNDSPTVLGWPTVLTATVMAGNPATFTWTFGDGSTGSGAILSHAYPTMGVYTAVVTAANRVSSATVSTRVVIVPADHRIYLPLVFKH